MSLLEIVEGIQERRKTRKKVVRPIPWSEVKSAFLAERMEDARILEQMLSDKHLDFGVVVHCFEGCALSLSGPELERVMKGLIKLLRNE